ncbi:LETM1-related biofilm-associated protein [Winogradskyella sp. 3972H.M.0a.05]|uniref:LETM1-related biofilm-associated protein n=1 Tax=Winogradskyella sp. 3972H.M.0a.05 TaxID=2950277 RepID=UPI003393CACC
MNPSASGWVKKLMKHINDNHNYLDNDNATFYHSLKESGFIYGSNVATIESSISINDLTDEELCKVNLVLAHYYVFSRQNSKTNFIYSLIDFYRAINETKTSFIEELIGQRKSSGLLEKIIHKRVHIDDNLLTKSFNHFIINALLFVDVLAYNKFLKTGNITKDYIQDVETAIEVIVFKVFESKPTKTEYDQSLLKLFESSLRFHNNDLLEYDDVIGYINSNLEKQYIIDIVCMASWSDKVIDKKELEFLNQIKTDLSLDDNIITSSVDDINWFYNNNKDKIAFLNSKNLVQSFYDNSSKLVNKLIKRNSKRLLKELKESKEVMVLLTQSTTRKLTDEEQKQIQNQLLDIFKSIPSLAIFMLPGGMILLPLFIKFIPKLLPSAFDDNRIEDD